NNRSLRTDSIDIPASWLMKFGADLHLLEIVAERVKQRVSHLLGIRKMDRTFESVTETSEVYGIPDDDRVARALQFIGETKSPAFVHLHLMESHCCTFRPRTRVFSADREKEKGK